MISWDKCEPLNAYLKILNLPQQCLKGYSFSTTYAHAYCMTIMRCEGIRSEEDVLSTTYIMKCYAVCYEIYVYLQMPGNSTFTLNSLWPFQRSRSWPIFCYFETLYLDCILGNTRIIYIYLFKSYNGMETDRQIDRRTDGIDVREKCSWSHT